MTALTWVNPRVGAHPDLAKQAAWDAIAAISDLGHGVGVTTGGDGGCFRDIGLTSICTGNDECLGLKSFGINKPNTHNLGYLGNTSLTPSNALVWFKDLTQNTLAPRYIDRGNWDRYLECYNGPPNICYYETASSISPNKIQPIDFVLALRYLPQTADEGVNRIKMIQQPATQKLSAIDGWSPAITLANGNHYPFYQDCVVRVLVRADNTWQVWINGVSLGTGTGGSFLTNEWIWGTNSHVLGCHLRYNIVKFGEFTSGEIASIYLNSQIIWPWNVVPKFPYIQEIHYGDASTFDSTLKIWTPGRGKTVVFSGGSGVEGTSLHMWYCFSSTDSVLYPSADGVLTNHRPIPGTFNISTIASGNSLTQVSINTYTGSLNLLSAPISFNTSATITADDIVTNINTNQNRFLARKTSTSTIQLYPIGLGCNNYATNAITLTASGFTPTKVDPPRGASLNRTTYAVAGQIFDGIAGNGTTKIMRVTLPVDSLGTAGPWIPTAWILDNIA